jgi:hypothetical protein
VTGLTGCYGTVTLTEDSDNCLLGWRLGSASIARRPASAGSCDRPCGLLRDCDSGRGLGRLPAGLATRIGPDRVAARVVTAGRIVTASAEAGDSPAAPRLRAGPLRPVSALTAPRGYA